MLSKPVIKGVLKKPQKTFFDFVLKNHKIGKRLCCTCFRNVCRIYHTHEPENDCRSVFKGAFCNCFSLAPWHLAKGKQVSEIELSTDNRKPRLNIIIDNNKLIMSQQQLSPISAGVKKKLEKVSRSRTSMESPRKITVQLSPQTHETNSYS